MLADSNLTSGAVPCIQVPPGWHQIEFISDLHLQARDHRTFESWQRYMAQCSADALFILGDLFEVWTGDDGLDDPQLAFERHCLELLRETSRRLQVHFMRGNRDFLVRRRFFQDSGMTELSDPCVLTLPEQRVLLTHGDAWCWSDTDYMAFRNEVRTVQWQDAFLSQPLEQRLAAAKGMRERSESLKQSQQDYVDLDPVACEQVMAANDCQILLHGHTHQPADHALATGRTRMVLSDWDATSSPARLQILRWNRRGWQRIELQP